MEPQYLPCQESVPNGNINPASTNPIEIIQQALKKKKKKKLNYKSNQQKK